MSYTEIRGNLFSSEAEAFVNTVNCVGAMGKGIALDFRRRFPQMFELYVEDCSRGRLKPGHVYYYPHDEKLILNFAIKGHWKYPSRIEWIESCLHQFVQEYRPKNIQSVAFPWMGAMNGGLPLEQIKAVTRKYLRVLTDIDVEVYEFDPNASDPLYEVLRDVVNSLSETTFAKESRLQKRTCLKIIESIRNGQINSLPNLVNSGIIGEQSIDKLYLFLSRYRKKADRQPQQLSFLE